MRSKVGVSIGLMMALSGSILPGEAARGAILWDNGPWITNPTGGTGAIAGKPISNAQVVPGSTGFAYTTAGVAASDFEGVKVADDFTIPVGGARLGGATFYGFQSFTAGDNVTAVKVNLWTAAPFDANSPPPLPPVLPHPVLATDLVIPVTHLGIAGYRETSTGTSSTSYTTYAYGVDLSGLGDAGVLSAGTYWLQWSYVTSNTTRTYMPIVTPRESAINLDARQFATISQNGQNVTTWFEQREYNGVDFNQALDVPFVLSGTNLPEPSGTIGAVAVVVGTLVGRARRA